MTFAGQTMTAWDRLPRMLIINAILLVALMAGYVLAFGQVKGYETHLIRQQFTLSGNIPTPILRITPTASTSDIIAIIVHGYSGSKELMVGFGIELARIGISSYLLDLPGHGESEVPFDPRTTDNRNPQLEAALDEVVSYARIHTTATHPRIVLIGHSLGTQVAGEYALHHPAADIAATVLISPVLADMPTPAQPANLLILYGQGDITGIIPLAQKLFAAGCTGEMQGISHAPADNFQSCGTFGNGFERRLAIIPGANHITILTDAHTYRQIQFFINSTLGDSASYDPATDDGRILWALLGVICAFGATFPLITLVTMRLPRTDTGLAVTTTAQATWSKLGLVAVSVVGTVMVLRLWALVADRLGAAGLRTPFTWLHMALADYTSSFAVMLALILGGLHLMLRRPLPWPRIVHWWWQLALAAVIGVALYLAIGTLATAAWTRLLLDGARSWRFILIALAQLPLFALFVGLFHDEQGWRGLLAPSGAFLLVCLGYVAAITLDRSLFFLSLVVPIEALLFGAFVLLGRWLAMQRLALSLTSAVLMAGILAWAVAAIFPIVR